MDPAPPPAHPKLTRRPYPDEGKPALHNKKRQGDVSERLFEV